MGGYNNEPRQNDFTVTITNFWGGIMEPVPRDISYDHVSSANYFKSFAFFSIRGIGDGRVPVITDSLLPSKQLERSGDS